MILCSCNVLSDRDIRERLGETRANGAWAHCSASSAASPNAVAACAISSPFLNSKVRRKQPSARVAALATVAVRTN